MSLRCPPNSKAISPSTAAETGEVELSYDSKSKISPNSSQILKLAVLVISAVVAWRFSLERRALVSRGDAPKIALRAASNAYANHVDFELASNESFGFFTNIASQDWEEMRTATLGRVNYATGNPRDYMTKASSWYAHNWDPDLSCPNVARVGRGDGAKWLCDIDRLVAQSQKRKERYIADDNTKNKPGCLVYSVGSNGQFGFEASVKEKVGDACEVHTFDFDDFAHKIPPGLDIHFHAWGLKPSYDETLGVSRDGFGQRMADDHKSYGSLGPRLSGGKFKSLQETMADLGHTGMPIDIFKIDCEGCEWGTYRDWIEEVDTRQILVEVHSLPEVAPRFFSDIQKAGYVIFHKEMNIQWFWAFWDAVLGRGRCVEYAFLKLDPSYVEDRLDRGI